MASPESLQIDNQDRWHIVHLDLLYSLLVVHTSIAIPCVCLRKLLWPIELPEAVIDTDTFAKFLARITIPDTLEL